MKIIDDIAVQVAVPTALVDKLSKIERSEVQGSDGAFTDMLIAWDYDEISYATSVLDGSRPSFNLELPSPMLRDYKWPGFFKPFSHQRDTAAFLSIRPRAFCFNEAGTGKTSAAIWAADYLMELGLVRRVLVICPLSIMQAAWQADVMQTALHRSVGIAHGTAEKRAKVIGSTYEFVIINFDGVGVVADEIAKADFDLIIIDEANAYKTPSTKRWKTLAKILRPTTRLWMMTGTPASQSPVDAFGLAKMVSPDRVPKYLTQWQDRVMLKVSKFKFVPRRDSSDNVFYALQPAIRFTKKECLDLPDVVYQTREITLSPQVRLYYERLRTQLLIKAAGEEVSAVNAAASLSKLLQISGGAVYTDGGEVVEFDIAPRLNALEEVLDETVNKVIIFVPYIHTIQLITKFLTSLGISSEVICGDVTMRNRSNIITKFQTQHDPRVLVIQPQSASHGLTLTAADTIVFWSPVMSVETYIQCIGRIDRVGQRNKMTVVHLQGSEVERKVYAMLQGKVDSHQKLVDLYKQELGI